MPKPKPKRLRRFLKITGITLGSLAVFLLLFVVAFVWNPLEGSLPELRDVVPRGVNFFVRKERLADDFTTFPEPKFWASLTATKGFQALIETKAVQDVRRDGFDDALREAAAAVERVSTDSGGWIDVMRDLIGTELIVAGYEQDYSQAPPRPLARPWWCCYTRVSQRVRAAHGLLRFGFVQDELRAQGIEITTDDDLLSVKLPGAADTLLVKRHLDVLMVANNRMLLDQSQRLIDGNRDEEPIGQMPAYTDGAQSRIQEWARANGISEPNVIEFVVEPNAFDTFGRRAAEWPNPQHPDSMNQRVLATFLNLKGWQQVTGGLLFADGVLALTGQVGLNSRQHTPFQSSFYRAEQQRREEWVDPFLAMVPEGACAAAALRMPAGEFLHAMFDALDEKERQLIDDGMKRATFRGQQVRDTRDLINKLSVAFLPRTGFVFRRNVPDLDRDEKGELKVPVTAQSPMPQVAWVFWLRPGSSPMLDEFVTMMRTNFQSFGFRKVWHLKVPHASGVFAEPVSEFVHPQIPATGAIAMIVFADFFVVANSGPFIREILRTRYPLLSGLKSIRDLGSFSAGSDELPSELNGLVWLRGDKLVQVIDDYITFAESSSERPDPSWQKEMRPSAEEHVRRNRYPQYPSVASIPQTMRAPGGEFDQAVVAHLEERWTRERTNFTAKDRSDMQQLRALSQMLDAALVHVVLENNYIRFLARVKADMR